MVDKKQGGRGSSSNPKTPGGGPGPKTLGTSKYRDELRCRERVAALEG